MSNRSYDRLKETNLELMNEKDKLTEELNAFRKGLVRAEGIPDFLFSSEVSNDELYSYLKKNPEASGFLFRKYQKNNDFMKEIIDHVPGNPLFLPKVADALKGILEIEETIKDISKMKDEKNKLRDEITELRDEITELRTATKEKENEFNEILNAIPDKMKEKDDLERFIANLRSDQGLSKTDLFIQQVSEVTQSIIDNQPGVEVFLNERNITRDQFALIVNMRNMAKDLRPYLQSNDFISEAYLDEKRSKLKAEMENVVEENRAYVEENLGKNNKKVLDILYSAVNPFGDSPSAEAYSGQDFRFLFGSITTAIEMMEKSEVRKMNLKRVLKKKVVE